jgi:NADPH-dependent 2,4-dienoyl-CoA reductase/sulfur reductase-like enzyme
MGLPEGIGCAVNPDIGYEHEMILQPAERKKKVMVIGGGPAGLEAARVAAERGHEVSVYERLDHIGGQIVTAGKATMRIDFAEPVRYYAAQLERLNVDLHLNEEVDESTIQAAGPDAVVVATGSTPLALEGVPGIDTANVTEVRAVLDETAEVGERVVMLADENHQESLATAEFLLDRGHDVTLVTRRHIAGEEIEHNTIVMLMQRVVEKGLEQIPLHWVRSLDGQRATLYSLLTDEEQEVEADTFVLALGGEADNALYERLKDRVSEVHLVGDAMAPRRLLYATRDGNRAGKAL